MLHLSGSEVGKQAAATGELHAIFVLIIKLSKYQLTLFFSMFSNSIFAMKNFVNKKRVDSLAKKTLYFTPYGFVSFVFWCKNDSLSAINLGRLTLEVPLLIHKLRDRGLKTQTTNLLQ